MLPTRKMRNNLVVRGRGVVVKTSIVVNGSHVYDKDELPDE